MKYIKSGGGYYYKELPNGKRSRVSAEEYNTKKQKSLKQKEFDNEQEGGVKKTYEEKEIEKYEEDRNKNNEALLSEIEKIISINQNIHGIHEAIIIPSDQSTSNYEELQERIESTVVQLHEKLAFLDRLAFTHLLVDPTLPRLVARKVGTAERRSRPVWEADAALAAVDVVVDDDDGCCQGPSEYNCNDAPEDQCWGECAWNPNCDDTEDCFIGMDPNLENQCASYQNEMSCEDTQGCYWENDDNTCQIDGPEVCVWDCEGICNWVGDADEDPSDNDPIAFCNWVIKSSEVFRP